MEIAQIMKSLLRSYKGLKLYRRFRSCSGDMFVYYVPIRDWNPSYAPPQQRSYARLLRSYKGLKPFFTFSVSDWICCLLRSYKGLKLLTGTYTPGSSFCLLRSYKGLKPEIPHFEPSYFVFETGLLRSYKGLKLCRDCAWGIALYEFITFL